MFKTFEEYMIDRGEGIVFKTFEEYMIDPSDLFRPHGTQDPIQEDVWVAAERILLDRDRDRLVQPDYD